MNAKTQTKNVVLTNHAVWLLRNKLENEASTISKNFQSVLRVAQHFPGNHMLIGRNSTDVIQK